MADVAVGAFPGRYTILALAQPDQTMDQWAARKPGFVQRLSPHRWSQGGSRVGIRVGIRRQVAEKEISGSQRKTTPVESVYPGH